MVSKNDQGKSLNVEYALYRVRIGLRIYVLDSVGVLWHMESSLPSEEIGDGRVGGR